MNLKLETLANIMYVLMPHSGVLGDSFGAVLSTVGCVVPGFGDNFYLQWHWDCIYCLRSFTIQR